MSGDLTIRLKPPAWRIFRDRSRFRVAVCGRRFGKTMLAVTEIAVTAARQPRSLVWFVAPTIDDARETAFKPLLRMLPKALVSDHTKSPLYIGLVNGSEIHFMSAEKSKRGRGLDLLVLDEFAFYGREVWEPELRPSLSDKQGRALFTTTPAGYNWAYDLYLRGLSEDDEWSSYSYTTLDGGWVPEPEVRAARETMDPRLFRQEYEASFETLSGRVYSNFDRIANVDEGLADTGGPVLVGIDFNVHPMSAVIATRAGDECHVLDALEVPTSNTEEMARELRRRYPEREIVVCPDPTGRARRTSAPVGETDFTILRRHDLRVRAPSKPPPVVDRVNNVQSLLESGDGRRRLMVHPRATKLIRALDGLTYKEGTGQIDKTQGLDHITDALGYLCWQEFNVLIDREFRPVRFRV